MGHVGIGESLQEFHISKNDGTESIYAKIEENEEVDVTGDNESEDSLYRWYMMV